MQEFLKCANYMAVVLESSAGSGICRFTEGRLLKSCLRHLKFCFVFLVDSISHGRDVYNECII